MPFDFQHVEGEEDDLADADEGAGGGVHDGFAGAWAEEAVEGGAVVEGEVVAREGLAAVLVDSLEDLGGGGVGVLVFCFRVVGFLFIYLLFYLEEMDGDG